MELHDFANRMTALLRNAHGAPEHALLTALAVGLLRRDPEAAALLSEQERLEFIAFRNRFMHGTSDEHERNRLVDRVLAVAPNLGTIDVGLQQVDQWLLGDDPALHGLPSEVADLVVALAELQEADSVYAPWDAAGQLAVRAAATGADVAVEVPIPTLQLTVAKLLTKASFDVVRGDPIAQPSIIEAGQLRRFDVSLAHPPVRTGYQELPHSDPYNRFPLRSPSGTVLAVCHALAQAKRRAVLVVPASLLSAAGSEEKLRRMLVETGAVQAVVGLPPHLLPSTVQLAILVLDPRRQREEVRLVDAACHRFCARSGRARNRLININELAAVVLDRQPTERLSRNLGAAELRQQHWSWQPARYLAPASQNAFIAFPRTRTIALGELVNHLSSLPNSVRRRGGEEKPSQLREVVTQDIPASGFINSVAKGCAISEAGVGRQEHLLLRPMDLVLVIKGAVGKVGVLSERAFCEDRRPIVVGQPAIALRVADPSAMDPRALCMLLRSAWGQTRLRALVAGTTTPLIQLRDVLALELPLLSTEEQRRAAEVLEHEQALQLQIDRLHQEQAALAAGLWTPE